MINLHVILKYTQLKVIRNNKNIQKTQRLRYVDSETGKVAVLAWKDTVSKKNHNVSCKKHHCCLLSLIQPTLKNCTKVFNEKQLPP